MFKLKVLSNTNIISKKKAFFKDRLRRLDGKDVNVVEEGDGTRSEF